MVKKNILQRMIGSKLAWVGAVIIFVYSYFIGKICAGCLMSGLFQTNCSNPDIKIAIIFSIIGFIIGCLIDILFFKKKRKRR